MGNHSKCFKCGELDEFCVCRTGAAPAQPSAAPGIEQWRLKGTTAWYDVTKEDKDATLGTHNGYERRTVYAAPTSDQQAGAVALTEQQVADMLGNSDLITDRAHIMLINGDPIHARLELLTRFANHVRSLAAPAAIEQAGAQPVAPIHPMCERKTADIEQRGYTKTGYVLKQDGERICVSDSGAVAWFTKDEWNWLMFNRDHVEFAWPKPIGHLVAPTPATDLDALDAKRYRWLRRQGVCIPAWEENGMALWHPGRVLDNKIDASLAATPVTDQPKQGDA